MNNETKLILEADYKRDGLNHFWLIVNYVNSCSYQEGVQCEPIVPPSFYCFNPSLISF